MGTASEGDVVILLHRHRGLRRRGLLLLVATALLVAATLLVATALLVTTTLLVATALLVVAAAVAIGALLGLATALRAVPSATEQLQILRNDADTAALLAGLLILPRIHLQAAFDEYGATFGEVLSRYLTRAPPASYVEKGSLFAPLAFVLPVGDAVHRKAKLSEGSAARSCAYFGISRQIPDNHNFV